MLGVSAVLDFSNLPKGLVVRANKGQATLAVFAVAIVTANILCRFTRIRTERIESALLRELHDHCRLSQSGIASVVGRKQSWVSTR